MTWLKSLEKKSLVNHMCTGVQGKQMHESNATEMTLKCVCEKVRGVSGALANLYNLQIWGVGACMSKDQCVSHWVWSRHALALHCLYADLQVTDSRNNITFEVTVSPAIRAVDLQRLISVCMFGTNHTQSPQVHCLGTSRSPKKNLKAALYAPVDL